jgi:hypothetical protein
MLLMGVRLSLFFLHSSILLIELPGSGLLFRCNDWAIEYFSRVDTEITEKKRFGETYRAILLLSLLKKTAPYKQPAVY